MQVEEMYDRLTGVLHRDAFLTQFQALLAAQQHGALLLFDVDEFKLINEVYGYTVGDGYLAQLADRLNSRFVKMLDGEGWLLGRLGEDEFAVTMPGKAAEDAWLIAERVRTLLTREIVANDSIRPTLSAGIVLYPEQGHTVSDLLSRVNIALSQAKRNGKNCSYLFCPAERELEILHSHLRKKECILRALEGNRFEPWFQPIFSVSDLRVESYEALARMVDEDGTWHLPEDFLSTAEEFGLISEIDRQIVAKTMYYQSKLAAHGQSLTFTLNLSAQALAQDDWLHFLLATLKQTGADPQRVIFEITESAAIQKPDSVIHFIHTLEERGCRFALDDFGAGFTSFVYLKELNVDYLKIDGSFIRRLHEQPEDQGIVRAMTTLAHELNLFTIAEFVEVPATLPYLNTFGVEYAQGFLLGRPAPTVQKNAQDKELIPPRLLFEEPNGMKNDNGFSNTERMNNDNGFLVVGK